VGSVEIGVSKKRCYMCSMLGQALSGSSKVGESSAAEDHGSLSHYWPDLNKMAVKLLKVQKLQLHSKPLPLTYKLDNYVSSWKPHILTSPGPKVEII
jgi:hypothetical protein